MIFAVLAMFIIATPMTAQTQWGHVNANLNGLQGFFNHRFNEMNRNICDHHRGTGDGMEMQYCYGYTYESPYYSTYGYSDYGYGYRYRPRISGRDLAIAGGIVGGGLILSKVFTKSDRNDGPSQCFEKALKAAKKSGQPVTPQITEQIMAMCTGRPITAMPVTEPVAPPASRKITNMLGERVEIREGTTGPWIMYEPGYGLESTSNFIQARVLPRSTCKVVSKINPRGDHELHCNH